MNSPASVYAYTNPTNNAVGRVAKTTLDGFGRTIKQESGTGTYNSGNGSIALTTVVSTVDTAYDSCGCSPMGKLKQTSRPYAPGGTVYWTVYAYDGIGRTKTVKAPDGASTTSYTYSGVMVTVTDAASKAKTFTTDATGSLNQVSEPNPAGGAALLTNYSYDVFNRLRTVSMPRSNGTQTRTFTCTGALLTSATNPENGTVSNYYNADNTLNYKIDAKGQKMAFSYDSYKRVTQISKYPDGANEDLCQQVKYFYDSNPDNSNYPYNQYTAGRLVSVHYAGTNCQYVGSGLTGPWTIVTGNNYVEMYAYTQAGQVSNKRLRLVKQIGTSAAPYNPVTVSADMEAVYAGRTDRHGMSDECPEYDPFCDPFPWWPIPPIIINIPNLEPIFFGSYAGNDATTASLLSRQDSIDRVNQWTTILRAAETAGWLRVFADLAKGQIGARFPFKLKVSEDCYGPNGREIFYDLVMSDGSFSHQPTSIITELVIPVSGTPPNANGSGSSGQFHDNISAQGANGFQILQTFTATVEGIYGVLGFPAVPVFVETIDGRQYGTNLITASSNGIVNINGDTGLNSDGTVHRCGTNRY